MDTSQAIYNQIWINSKLD